MLSMEQAPASEAGLSDSAACRDAASYRDASIAKLERFLEEAKLLAEERISLGSSSADKRRKAAIDEKLQSVRSTKKNLPTAVSRQARIVDYRARDVPAGPGLNEYIL